MAAGRAATALVRSLGMRTKMVAPPHRLAAARGLSSSSSSSSPTPPPPPPPPPPRNMKAHHEGDPKLSRPSLGDRFVDALFTTLNMSIGIWFIGGAFVKPSLKALEDRIATLERWKMEDDMKATQRELERILNEHGGPKAQISGS